MSGHTCPMVARGNWDITDSDTHSAWHLVSKTQSPFGLRGNVTGGWLVFMNGCHRGEDARLPFGSTTIGSAWNTRIVLTGPEIGSHHATLTLSADSVTIAPSAPGRDLRINGERISATGRVEDGDLVSFAELHAIFRLARPYLPGQRPAPRPRPPVVPVHSSGEPALFTGAWLIAGSGGHARQDWRLVKGINRLGSSLDLEVTWPDGGLPPEACRLVCDLKGTRIAALTAGVSIQVNDAKGSPEQLLHDSDRLKINAADFFVKCM